MPQSLHRWTDCLRERPFTCPSTPSPHIVGVLKGEGIGPEVIDCALHVLAALEAGTGVKFETRAGGVIGRESEGRGGRILPEPVVEFCRGIFDAGGAVLNGPGGGRYVYELRRTFDLFCKLSPLEVAPELAGAGRLKPEHVRGVNILMVRENAAGVYQGTWKESGTNGDRVAEHRFSYREHDVSRILRTASRLAAGRRGHLTVVYKESGVPSISELWRECALRISHQAGVRCSLLDIDHMAYRLIQHPGEFDVVAAPNLFGDVLSDLGGVLLGSRGLSFAGSFAENGAAVYSTNHGAAYDLAGTDRANPIAQILSMAMMLRETFGLAREARLIEEAIRDVWRQGYRTADLHEPDCEIVGTQRMAAAVADAVLRRSRTTATEAVNQDAHPIAAVQSIAV
jgi:3-isopropylmalate dehydrogenase